MKNRIYIKDIKEHLGKETTIAGFVDVRRDHGKLIFIDLRDMSGKVQMVALPNHKEAHTLAAAVRSEWVIAVTGKVNKRPEKMINKDEPNGDIEMERQGQIRRIFPMGGEGHGFSHGLEIDVLFNGPDRLSEYIK